METSEGRHGTAPGRRVLWAWCSYDWANQPFPTIILTFVYAAYFTKAVAADEVTGTSQWAFAISLSMAAVAIAGPVLGAIADAAGRRKPWVFFFSAMAITASAMLWFSKPEASFVFWTLLWVGIGNFAFEMGIVFYNSMLPSLVSRDRMGRLSGWGWSLGYLGGLISLIASLVLFVQPNPPLFGLDAAAAQPVRATALLVAVWFVVFAVPFFLFVPDQPVAGRSAMESVRRGLTTLIGTFRDIRRHRQVALYLLARMIYNDGLNTLFAIGGIYAAVTFNMSFEQVLLFGIAINVTAGLGAFGFAWVDDWIGPKATISIALIAMSCLGVALVLIESQVWFWALALPLGIFLGPAQSASRSLMARLAPEAVAGEMFGLYALSGKATAFLGPAVFGWATAMSGSQRVGMATIIVFFVVGMLLLMPVRVPHGEQADRP